MSALDLNDAGQSSLLSIFEEMHPSVDFARQQAASHRYYYENPADSYSDAIMLHCMLRHLKPAQIIEVGSGYSSCVMLDTRERHLDGKTSVTLVEPYPVLLNSLLRPADGASVSIITHRLQDVPLAEFALLRANDVLFIDSTHVCKTGSDVNYLLFDALTALRSGVCVHVHDVLYPFEYPREWVFGGRLGTRPLFQERSFSII